MSRTCALITAGVDAGAQFVIENPVDRGDRSLARAFLHRLHGSIWQMPEVIALKEHSGAKVVNFCQCKLGAKWQKRTSLMYSSGFDDWLNPLSDLECDHPTHSESAGGERDEASREWNSADSAAYPPR